MSNYPDTEDEKAILRGLTQWRSPLHVANRLGFPLEAVYEVQRRHPHVSTLRPTKPQVEKFGGYGRPDLRPYLVARKQAHAAWHNRDPEIVAARRAYDAGTHEMVTGRDGQWLLLYSIPRHVAAVREPYFHA